MVIKASLLGLLLLVIWAGGFGYAAPMLISQPSWIAVGLGALVVIGVLVSSVYLGKKIVAVLTPKE